MIEFSPDVVVLCGLLRAAVFECDVYPFDFSVTEGEILTSGVKAIFCHESLLCHVSVKGTICASIYKYTLINE